MMSDKEALGLLRKINTAFDECSKLWVIIPPNKPAKPPKIAPRRLKTPIWLDRKGK